MTKSKWVIKIRTCSDKRLKNSRKRTANLRNWPTISTKCLRILMILAIQRRKRKNQRRKRKNQKRKRRKKKRKRRIKRIRRRKNRMRKIMLREAFVIATKRIKRRSTMPRSSSRKSSLKTIKRCKLKRNLKSMALSRL